MKYDERACKFIMDTGCVELLLRDGRMISIDCTGVEDELDVTMAQRLELDYLMARRIKVERERFRSLQVSSSDAFSSAVTRNLMMCVLLFGVSWRWELLGVS